MKRNRIKSITLRADGHLIDIARRQAASEHTTLNAKFGEWLEDHARHQRRAGQAMAHIEEMCTTVRTGGRKFTRDEMNER